MIERTGALLLWLLCATASAAGWDEHELLQALAQQARPVVHFSETRHLQYLDVPLNSSGELEFRPPDYLRRTVAGGESFEIAAGQLRLERAGEPPREVALDAYPGLRAFAESFRATLAGDIVVLHRYFDTELRGARAAWELRLTPKEAGIAAVIDHISLFGAGGQLTRVETYERSGDYTVTRLGGGDGA